MSHSRLLEGRTALITGAGAGLGLGVAGALAAAGANVVLAVRRREVGEAALAAIAPEGGRGLVAIADVAVPAQIQAAVEQAVAAFGGLDIAIHNANSPLAAMPLALEQASDADLEGQGTVAHLGGYALAHAAYPHLKRSGRGRFIMLASSFGMHGAGFNPIYAALKGGDCGFAKALAREWGPDRINVYAVAPSSRTPSSDAFFEANPALRDRYLANFPLGRIGDPRSDLGPAFVALCSDQFGYVTGQTIRVDGGLYTG